MTLVPLTTARKATTAATVAFVSPFYVLLQSDQPVTWRGALACTVAGVIGYLGTYSVSNDAEPYAPARRHARPPEG